MLLLRKGNYKVICHHCWKPGPCLKSLKMLPSFLPSFLPSKEWRTVRKLLIFLFRFYKIPWNRHITVIFQESIGAALMLPITHKSVRHLPNQRQIFKKRWRMKSSHKSIHRCKFLCFFCLFFCKSYREINSVLCNYAMID